MDIICTPLGIISTVHPGQGILDVTASGFQNILLDLSVFCSAGELEWLGNDQEKLKETTRPLKILISEHPTELYNTIKPLLKQYKKACLRTPIAYAPFLLRNTKRKDLSETLYCLALESIRCCDKSGSQYIIIKPLFSGIKREDVWNVNRQFYLRLGKEAKKHDIKILLENQCQEINGHLVRGICSDADEATFWIDRLNKEVGEERFGFCMDVGTCNLCGQNMQEFILSLQKRIKAVVLRDCDGYRESSMLPFTCSKFENCGTDWLGLIRGLREIGFDGELILNFSDTASSFSPLLRPQLMQLAKATAEYFKWQIGIENLLKENKSIVLFGAGNMCRNYMKCYGEKYPPLFTCDNNPKLWGTEFCGLEVKPPESLNTISEDCMILICNIYYREIEQQLRDMGISNRIKFFSDEYMPSFYFDRLERG